VTVQNSNEFSVTSIIAGNEALVGRGVVGEGATNELLVKGALDLAGHLVFDVVDDGVEVARVPVVSPLIRAVEVTLNFISHVTTYF
jgi:hypothetical protein